MAEIVNITYNGEGLETQQYSTKDNALITSNLINVVFGDPNDYIELIVTDQNNNLLAVDYNAEQYSPTNFANPVNNTYNSISIDPLKDLQSLGYNRGNINIQYNFLRKLFNSSADSKYWIKEISHSRREIKLASQKISNLDIRDGFNAYQTFVASLNYYNDFYLNFGNNIHIIAINVAYTEDVNGSYLIIKLYEPLPANISVKDQLWIVHKVAEPAIYNVDIQVETAVLQTQNRLRGPNFAVDDNEKVSQTTPYYNYQNLTDSTQQASFDQLMSYYQDKAIRINIDYSDFGNFVHFSSALSRVNNFVYKLSLIESYNEQITEQQRIQSSNITNTTIGQLTSSIQQIIENFDTYEYFMYYDSGSAYSWPKSTSTAPYSLYSVTSSETQQFLGTSTTTGLLMSASEFDVTNKDSLLNVIPKYILDDESNEPYITFVNMIGQHFDNIWIYYKDVTNRYNNTNNPNTGISIDLVSDALQSLGINIYTNTNVSDNLYYSLFGRNADGSLLPPTGSEVINNYITSSIATLSANDVEKEFYKRIYHNLPYLLKTKGTRNGLQVLINIFGIPESILDVNEFGGYDNYAHFGVNQINNDKIVTASIQEINSSILSKDTTLQYYNNDNRRNSLDVEVGFSPAKQIDDIFSSSIAPNINIDQFIGDPTYQYSASYPALNVESNNFFSSDEYKEYSHSIHEYIRLIKYYNNSLFKMIKDYVPARANVSTGMIIKSHVLERNKYERHEPTFNFNTQYSQSIDLVRVTGSDPANISGSTAHTTIVYNQSGSVTINNTYSWEKYTGDFGGNTIDTYSNDFDQKEISSISSPWTSSVNPTTGTYSEAFADGCRKYRYKNDTATTKTVNYVECYSGIVKQFSATSGSDGITSECFESGSIYGVGFGGYYSSSTPTPGVLSFQEVASGTPVITGCCCKNQMFTTYSVGALHQNITEQVRSVNHLDLDYSYQQTKPVNYNLITASIGECSTCLPFREDCYTYIVTNNNTSASINYSFNLCDNNQFVVYGLGPAGQEFIPCVRKGSVKLLNQFSDEDITIQEIEQCGTYRSLYDVDICNQATLVIQPSSSAGSFVSWSYSDCSGNTYTSSIEDTLGLGLTYSLGCIPNTDKSIQVISSQGQTEFVFGNDCDISSDGNNECLEYQVFSTGSIIGSFNISYTNCNNNAQSQLIPYPNINDCYSGLSRIILLSGFSGSAFDWRDCDGYKYTGYIPPNNLGTSIPINDFFNSGSCIRSGSIVSSVPQTSWTSGEGWRLDTSSLSDCGSYKEGAFICARSGSLSVNSSNIYYSSSEALGGVLAMNRCGLYFDEGGCSRYEGFLYAQLQDYNYSKQSIVNARYNGGKSISAKYNEYTAGDKTFGNGGAINKYYNVLGLFTEVVSSSYLDNEMVVKLSNFANVSGGLQELNLKNNNWVYFQNIFSKGGNATIKQFDATKYTDQKYLDRTREIVESGYSYRPYYYRATGSTQEVEYFTNDTFSGVDQSAYATLKDTNYRVYTIPSAGNSSGSSIWNYYSPALQSGSNHWMLNFGRLENFSGKTTNLKIYASSSADQLTFISASYFEVPSDGDGYYRITSDLAVCNLGVGVDQTITIKRQILKGSFTSADRFPEGTILAEDSNSIVVGASTPGFCPIWDPLTYTGLLSTGDKIFVKILMSGSVGYTANEQVPLSVSFNNASYESVSTDGIFSQSIDDSTYKLFDETYSTTSSLVLESAKNALFNANTTYDPSNTNAISPLYNRFGDIDYTTEIEVGDVLYIKYGSGLGTQFNSFIAFRRQITSVITNTNTGTKELGLDAPLPTYLNNNNINLYDWVVLTKKVPDETIVTLKGRKRGGMTSYGFLIPENINPNILQNIASLQSTIQTQILSTQPISDVAFTF